LSANESYSRTEEDIKVLTGVDYSQPLGELVICLGDGHDCIWNIFEQIANPEQRFEIPDSHLTQSNLQSQKQLLAKFHSVEYLRQATLDQIATTPGIGEKIAQIVFTHLHPNQ
jgi:Helix-hairpin-helix motif